MIDDDTSEQVQQPSTSKKDAVSIIDSEEEFEPIKSFSFDDFIEEDGQKNIFDQEYEKGIGKGKSKNKGKGKGKGKGKAKSNKKPTSDLQESKQTDDATPAKKQKTSFDNNLQDPRQSIFLVTGENPILILQDNTKVENVAVKGSENAQKKIFPSPKKNKDELPDLIKRKTLKKELKRIRSQKTLSQKTRTQSENIPNEIVVKIPQDPETTTKIISIFEKEIHEREIFNEGEV